MVHSLFSGQVKEDDWQASSPEHLTSQMSLLAQLRVADIQEELPAQDIRQPLLFGHVTLAFRQALVLVQLTVQLFSGHVILAYQHE